MLCLLSALPSPQRWVGTWCLLTHLGRAAGVMPPNPQDKTFSCRATAQLPNWTIVPDTILLPTARTWDFTERHLCKRKSRTTRCIHLFCLFGLCDSANSPPVCGCVCTHAHSQCPCTCRDIFEDFRKSSFRLTTKLRRVQRFPVCPLTLTFFKRTGQ